MKNEVDKIKKKRNARKVHCILTGDFNSRPESSVYSIIKKRKIDRDLMFKEYKKEKLFDSE